MTPPSGALWVLRNAKGEVLSCAPDDQYEQGRYRALAQAEEYSIIGHGDAAFIRQDIDNGIEPLSLGYTLTLEPLQPAAVWPVAVVALCEKEIRQLRDTIFATEQSLGRVYLKGSTDRDKQEIDTARAKLIANCNTSIATLESALAPANRGSQVSDRVCDEIIDELDNIAREEDSYDYGLPRFDALVWAKMRNAIKEKLSAAGVG